MLYQLGLHGLLKILVHSLEDWNAVQIRRKNTLGIKVMRDSAGESTYEVDQKVNSARLVL